MKQRILYIIFALFFAKSVCGQVIVFAPMIAYGMMPEHGFLPGKQFPFYSTVNKYQFNNRHLRVELYDDRDTAGERKVDCSPLMFTNTSEFAKPQCIYKVQRYIDTLLQQNGAVVDSAFTDTLQVKLQGIDARLIGFGYVKVHGLCQMQFVYHNVSKTYCIDIKDGDKNSPLGATSMTTRKTATRYMASAAIREVIEQFLVDLASVWQASAAP